MAAYLANTVIIITTMQHQKSVLILRHAWISSWEGVVSGADGTEHESLIDLEKPSEI